MQLNVPPDETDDCAVIVRAAAVGFGVMVNVVDPETLPRAAVIWVDPVAVPAVANPDGLIVATVRLDDVQATEEEMSLEVLSEYRPVAEN